MSKIVKYTEFKKVVDALWDNVKNNFVTITKSLEFVSKIKPNVISEKTAIVDGYVLGSKVSSVDNKPNTPSYMRAGGFFIYELLQIPNGTKVSHITIGVNDSLNVGDTVSGVVVGFAKHKTTIDHINKTYEIVEYLVQDGKGVVHKNTDTDLTCDKAVSIVVDKEMTDDLVLIVGCENAIWGEKTGSVLNGLAYGGGTAPIVGSEVPLGYGNWVGKVSIYAEGASLNDLSKNVTTMGTELKNKVDKSQIGNTNGMIPQIGAGDKLATSIIPDLAITSVQVVNEKTDAQNLVTSNSIQVGDVVVIANDNNSVHMYNGETNKPFEQSFIELSLGEGTIKVINNQRPDATGSLTLNGTQINVDGQLPGTTIKDELDKCVRTVNNQDPINGNVNIYATQISAFDGFTTGNVQSHLTSLRTETNNHATRIGALERKKPTIHVGEIITTFKDNGDRYTLNGVTYLYCGKANNLITSANYPELTAALGLTGVASYNLPVINDIEISYDYTRRAKRKHYIVAKID